MDLELYTLRLRGLCLALVRTQIRVLVAFSQDPSQRQELSRHHGTAVSRPRPTPRGLREMLLRHPLRRACEHRCGLRSGPDVLRAVPSRELHLPRREMAILCDHHALSAPRAPFDAARGAR